MKDKPTTTSKVVLLGPIKLTWGQIPTLPKLEEQAYIRSLTAKEIRGGTREMVKNLNNQVTDSIMKR